MRTVQPVRPKASDVRAALATEANPKKAEVLRRFFKTGKGEYGEGDVFLGIVVPVQRSVAKRFRDLDLTETCKLLKSRIHEERLTALLILVDAYEHGTPEERSAVTKAYLASTKWINNWDLVDLSAPNIVGKQFLNTSRATLMKLAHSKDIWERRIAILSTLTFIRANDFADAFRISEILLNDPHDLIHKAVGWMLREIGKRDRAALDVFLERYAKRMPRTMLRYAIERHPAPAKRKFMSK